MIDSLKKSKMLKVCKDQWNVKRRLAYHQKVRADVEESVQSLRVEIQGKLEQVMDNYKIRYYRQSK